MFSRTLTAEFYIGQTADLDRRIAQHNDPGNSLARTTKRFRGPWTLLHAEQAADRSTALLRERELRTSRGRAWIRSLPRRTAENQD